MRRRNFCTFTVQRSKCPRSFWEIFVDHIARVLYTCPSRTVDESFNGFGVKHEWEKSKFQGLSLENGVDIGHWLHEFGAISLNQPPVLEVVRTRYVRIYRPHVLCVFILNCSFHSSTWSTPSVRADSSCWRNNKLCGHKTTTQAAMMRGTR